MFKVRDKIIFQKQSFQLEIISGSDTSSKTGRGGIHNLETAPGPCNTISGVASTLKKTFSGSEGDRYTFR